MIRRQALLESFRVYRRGIRSYRFDPMTDSYIARASKIASRVLGNETLIMSGADSTIFTLNEVATAIWQAADGRTPLSQIVTGTVCSQFDIDPESARRDAEEFVSQLSQHGILLVSDQPITQPHPGPKEAA